MRIGAKEFLLLSPPIALTGLLDLFNKLMIHVEELKSMKGNMLLAYHLTTFTECTWLQSVKIHPKLKEQMLFPNCHINTLKIKKFTSSLIVQANCQQSTLMLLFFWWRRNTIVHLLIMTEIICILLVHAKGRNKAHPQSVRLRAPCSLLITHWSPFGSIKQINQYDL